MGFVLWYKVEVSAPGPLPLPLVLASNDVFSGRFLLDAEIDVPMFEGDSAAEFVVKLINLPAATVDALKAAQAQGADTKDPMKVKVQLGYFDRVPLVSPPGDVLVGAVTGVKTSVDGEGQLVTELRGHEMATWRLLRLCNVTFSPGGPVTPAACVAHVLDKAGGVAQQGAVVGGSPRENFALRASNGLAALGIVARWAGTRFSVRDNAVHWAGPAAGLPAALISSDSNLVQLDDGQSAGVPTRRCQAPENAAVEVETSARIDATVLGDPKLRPGQSVTVKKGDEPPRALHLEAVTQHFSTSSGYTCELGLAENGDGPPGTPRGGAQRVVHRMRELTETRRDQRPAISMGEVTEYQPGKDAKHLATVKFGQSPGADVVAPSVESPILDTELHNKPIVSPFAWHKCGLVVPAYPGQRTLLAHNRGDSGDAVLSGYVWAEEPVMDRPANEPGDWWLCLPTEVSGGQPAGKGVNDLTDASGLRAIQAKGLKVEVGESKLAEVGQRPDVPEADTFTIDHGGGTKVSIASDGAIEIITDSKAITLGNGTSSLKLDGSTVELTNGSVTVALSGSSVEVK